MTGMDAAFIDQIDAEDAWNVLSIDEGAALIDVRTEYELDMLGHPNLSDLNRPVWHIEWRSDRLSAIKAHFVLQVEEALEDQPATHLIFYCDDGRRALSAAQVVAAVFAKSDETLDVSCIKPEPERVENNAWQAAGLPWTRRNR